MSRRQHGRAADQWLLAVEVVSPHSRNTDRFFEPFEYADAGVPAYWRVELDLELVEVVQELGGRGAVEVPFRVELDLPPLLPRLTD